MSIDPVVRLVRHCERHAWERDSNRSSSQQQSSPTHVDLLSPLWSIHLEWTTATRYGRPLAALALEHSEPERQLPALPAVDRYGPPPGVGPRSDLPSPRNPTARLRAEPACYRTCREDALPARSPVLRARLTERRARRDEAARALSRRELAEPGALRRSHVEPREARGVGPTSARASRRRGARDPLVIVTHSRPAAAHNPSRAWCASRDSESSSRCASPRNLGSNA